MSKTMDKLEAIILPLSEKLSTNKVIQSISKGLMSLMSIFIVGAVASILANVPINGYQGIITSMGLKDLLSKIVDITTNMLALYAVFSIAYAYVKTEGENGLAAGLISLMSFCIVTPMTISGEGWTAVKNLPLSWLGAKGLFVAMFVAIITSIIYVSMVKKNITIKMPDSVPEFVSKSFVSIIPALVIVFLFAIINLIVGKTSFGDLHQFIYTIIGKPLTGIGTSLPAIMLIYALAGLCWFFGVHGIAVISLIMPIGIAADAENLAAYTAGVANSDLPNIITYNWTNLVSNMGGAGATLGLVILLLLRAKSEQHKAVGKLCIVPALFCINEPLIFGLPCVLNSTLFIPFVLAQPILMAIAYFLTKIGFLAKATGVSLPMGSPIIFNAALSGGWTIIVWQICAILISMALYYPFFRILDKQALLEEKATVNN